jgi:hypothetical protein
MIRASRKPVTTPHRRETRFDPAPSQDGRKPTRHERISVVDLLWFDTNSCTERDSLKSRVVGWLDIRDVSAGMCRASFKLPRTAPLKPSPFSIIARHFLPAHQCRSSADLALIRPRRYISTPGGFIRGD